MAGYVKCMKQVWFASLHLRCYGDFSEGEAFFIDSGKEEYNGF